MINTKVVTFVTFRRRRGCVTSSALFCDLQSQLGCTGCAGHPVHISHWSASHLSGISSVSSFYTTPLQGATVCILSGRVFIHPGSVNFDVGKFDSGWLVYTEMVATAKLYVRESSMVPVYALLLFGGRFNLTNNEATK